MQAQAIRHDGLERMIEAFRFFAAIVHRVRNHYARSRKPAAAAQPSDLLAGASERG